MITKSTHRGRPARSALRAAVVAATAGALGLALGTPALSAAPAAAPATKASAAAGPAWVRAAHLIPELGEMTIRLVPFAGTAASDVPTEGIPEAVTDGTAKVVEPTAGYGTVGEYRQVPAGVYAVTVRPTGTSTETAPLLSGTFVAAADKAFTLAAVGTKDAPRIDTISDELKTPKAGTARVRLLPAVPEAESITVIARQGPTIAKDAPFGRPTDYATVPSGRWTLDVTTNGTGGERSLPAAATVDVASGGVFTVFVLDGGNGAIELKPAVDAASMGAAPQDGVQTGAGGTAVQPGASGVVAGWALAGAGAMALLVLAVRRRPSVVPLGRR